MMREHGIAANATPRAVQGRNMTRCMAYRSKEGRKGRMSAELGRKPSMAPRPRLYGHILEGHLAQHRQMAFVSGPCQVGKTTTCRGLSTARPSSCRTSRQPPCGDWHDRERV
jgi:hypothetical protein